MKRWIVTLAKLAMASGAWAEGWSETYSLAGGTVQACTAGYSCTTATIGSTGSFWFAGAAMAAGLETLRIVRSSDYLERIVTLGERLRTGLAASADALRAFCAERLSDYKVPETFTLLETPLPRNANGKLLKRALRDAVAAQLPTE